jgi:hypothetical protein
MATSATQLRWPSFLPATIFSASCTFAAESHVDRSILGPRAFVETNVVGTLNLLAAARDRWQDSFAGRLFLHISTDEVFGDPCATCATVSTRARRTLPIAPMRRRRPRLITSYAPGIHTYGFPAIITNCSNNYGPWQFPEKLIPLMILNAIGGTRAAGLRRWPPGAGLAARATITAMRCSQCSNGGRSVRPMHRRRATAYERASSQLDLRLWFPSALGRRHARTRLIRHVEDRPATTDATHRQQQESAANSAGRRATS